jgi:hypothetical protein
MVNTFSMLAEVVDKEPTLAWLWTVAAILAIASFVLCRWRRWTALFAGPAVVIWIWLLLPELHDRFVGPAILQELGRGYVIQTYLAAFGPLFFLVLGLSCKRREPSNQTLEPTAGRHDEHI